eukprot:SAG31_NODE_9561_length_1258_cov_2.832614_2_plen_98_part_00
MDAVARVLLQESVRNAMRERAAKRKCTCRSSKKPRKVSLAVLLAESSKAELDNDSRVEKCTCAASVAIRLSAENVRASASSSGANLAAECDENRANE